MHGLKRRDLPPTHFVPAVAGAMLPLAVPGRASEHNHGNHHGGSIIQTFCPLVGPSGCILGQLEDESCSYRRAEVKKFCAVSWSPRGLGFSQEENCIPSGPLNGNQNSDQLASGDLLLGVGKCSLPLEVELDLRGLLDSQLQAWGGVQ